MSINSFEITTLHLSKFLNNHFVGKSILDEELVDSVRAEITITKESHHPGEVTVVLSINGTDNYGVDTPLDLNEYLFVNKNDDEFQKQASSQLQQSLGSQESVIFDRVVCSIGEEELFEMLKTLGVDGAEQLANIYSHGEIDEFIEKMKVAYAELNGTQKFLVVGLAVEDDVRSVGYEVCIPSGTVGTSNILYTTTMFLHPEYQDFGLFGGGDTQY